MTRTLQERGEARPQAMVAVLAFVAVFAVLAGRWLAPLSIGERAKQLLLEAGAELQDRSLEGEEASVLLESRQGIGRQSVTLGQLAQGDQLVLVHFWAGWCPPCLEELPRLLGLAEALRGRSFQLVAISYDDTWEQADAALERATGRKQPGVGTWLRDPAGQSGPPEAMLRLRMGTEQLPETYVVYRGRVLGRFVAAQDWASPRIQKAFWRMTTPTEVRP